MTGRSPISEAASNYAARGWCPIPLPHKSKRPVVESWQDLRLTTPEDITAHFNGAPQNIGVLLGEPSGWLIDVDLDHEHAVEMGDAYLPATGAVFGRPGNPDSHRIYIVTAPVETHRMTHAPLGTIVELRSTGGQTVFPPSTHTSGEPIRWSKTGTPATVAPQDLLGAVNKLYRAVLDRNGIQPDAAPRQQENRGAPRLDIVERCWRYVAKMPDAISGQGGHDATFAAACKCFQFGLTDSEALEVMRRFNSSKTGDEPWTDRELAHKLSDARQKVTTAGEFGSMVRDDRRQSTGEQRRAAMRDDDTTWRRGTVTNSEQSEMIEVETGKPKPVIIPLSMDEILQRTEQQTDGWPRRVDNVLFVHDDEHGIAWLEKPPALFGYLHRRVGKVTWRQGPSLVGRGEFFAELQRTATRYVAVEDLPHEPPIEGHYYACNQLEPGDGATLRKLLTRFNPETDVDHDLIKAAFMTPMWGGPPGTRPAFVVTSDDGRGAGKSKLVEFIGLTYNGSIDFSQNEEIGKIKTRLLSPDALVKRVLALDNVKSHRFSWGELEALITAPAISGHRMYVGEAMRPNTLTWFITLNGAALSTDMAQRAVIIKIKKPERSDTWEEETRLFILEHRRQLLADIVAALRTEKAPLAKFTRWATWEKDVLQRLPEPGEAQKVIRERQDGVDVESEEAGIIEDFYAEQLSNLGYKPDKERVFIPSQVAARWYGWATNERVTVGGASRILNQLVTEGRLHRLERNRCKTWGRGLVWHGERAGMSTAVSVDIRDRIAQLQGGQGA